MKLVCWGGTPTSGKTTLMRYIVKELGSGSVKKNGLLMYQHHPSSKCLVLGSYAKAGFGGTDRLSMAVQPIALGVIQSWASNSEMKDWTVLFEGDRLFNQSFLKSLVDIPSLDYYLFMLTVSPETQHRRHKDRKDSQNETWLKGRLTKCKRLQESIEDLTVLKNETVDDLKRNVEIMLKIIKG